ncbi:hypothetical protein ACFL6G_09870, partial [candidate division KSB1 bacterium]
KSRFHISGRYYHRDHLYLWRDNQVIDGMRGLPTVVNNQVIKADWIETGIGINYIINNKTDSMGNTSFGNIEESLSRFCLEVFGGMSIPSNDSFNKNNTDFVSVHNNIFQTVSNGKDFGIKLLYTNSSDIYPYIKFEKINFNDDHKIPNLFWSRIFDRTDGGRYAQAINNINTNDRNCSLKKFSVGAQYHFMNSDPVSPYIFGEISLCKMKADGELDSELYDEYSRWTGYNSDILGFKGSFELETRNSFGGSLGIGFDINFGNFSIVPEFLMTFLTSPSKDYSTEYTLYDYPDGIVFDEQPIYSISEFRSFTINTLQFTLGIRYSIPNFLK